MTDVNVSPFGITGLSQQNKYILLREYYSNNLLYNAAELTQLLNPTNFNLEAMKPLRTPVNRATEFYVAKVATGLPKVISVQLDLIESVEKFFAWSDFDTNKAEEIRNTALLGISFKKIVSTNDKVYQEIIDPFYVTNFQEDSRGFITEIRIDTPVIENDVKMTRTEYWTLADGAYVAVWVHNQGSSTPLDELGTPQYFAYLAEFGIDFIPIVSLKFRKTSKKYPMGAVEHCILKIDELNRMSTRLNQMLFRYNKPLWAVSANSADKDGRPIPAPILKDATTGAKSTSMNMDNRDIVYLPGTSSIASLVPDIRYAEALAILQAQEQEIKEDLPELLYYSLQDRDLSGKAFRTILGSAVDRAIELENNFIKSQVRADMMALTIGAFIGVFSNLGNFDNGELLHTLEFDPMFPLTQEEKSLTLQKLPVEIPIRGRMRMAGYSEEEIDLVLGIAAV